MNIRNNLEGMQPIPAESQISGIEKPSSPSSIAPAIAQGDHTHLSSAASLIGHAVSLSDVRPAKVQSIQAAIASGSYSVSCTDVAHSLMSHMLGNQE